MKTVTVKADELDGDALGWAAQRHLGELGAVIVVNHAQKGFEKQELRRAIENTQGPTVEVPAELMEDKA